MITKNWKKVKGFLLEDGSYSEKWDFVGGKYPYYVAIHVHRYDRKTGTPKPVTFQAVLQFDRIGGTSYSDISSDLKNKSSAINEVKRFIKKYHTEETVYHYLKSNIKM
jgi:hypothetical protein